jgi:hypothetical protein
MLVDLAVFREFREVVDKGGVNHAVGHCCSAAQTLKVFERTAMDFSSGRDQRLGAGISAGEPEHLMSRSNQLLHDGGTDESRSSCHKYFHCSFLLILGDP